MFTMHDTDILSGYCNNFDVLIGYLNVCIKISDNKLIFGQIFCLLLFTTMTIPMISLFENCPISITLLYGLMIKVTIILQCAICDIKNEM